MPDRYSEPDLPEHPDYPNFIPDEDRVEEPPFVNSGDQIPVDIATGIPVHVINFEQAWKESRPVSISELLGMPVIHHEKDLDEASLEKELSRMLELLQQRNILIEVPPDSDPRSIYRHLTEHVLQQEVDDLRMVGLVRHFFMSDRHDADG